MIHQQADNPNFFDKECRGPNHARRRLRQIAQFEGPFGLIME